LLKIFLIAHVFALLTQKKLQRLLLFVQIRVVVLAVFRHVLQHLLLLLLQDLRLFVENVGKQVLDLRSKSITAAAAAAERSARAAAYNMLRAAVRTLGFLRASASLNAFKIAALRSRFRLVGELCRRNVLYAHKREH
jgi:hypothetical protein